MNKKLIWIRAYVLPAERTGSRFSLGIRLDPDRHTKTIASYEAPDYRPDTDLVTVIYVFSDRDARRVRNFLKRGEIPPLDETERRTFVSD